MAIVNKVLNGLIALLAILTCYVSINMYNKRVVLKDRGDKLQKVVSQTAKSLDGEEGSSALGTTYGEDLADDKLSWEKWAESEDARAEYEKKINELPGAAKTVVEVKAGLAKAAVGIAKTLETPAAAEENFETSLNYATGWEKGMTSIQEHAGKVTAQRDGLVAGIVATSKAINKPVSEEALTIESESYDKTLEILADNAKTLKSRADDLSTSYAESVAKLKKALGDKFKLRTDEDLLKSESAQDYKEASADFQTKDVATIAKAITKYLRSEQIIAKLQADNVEQAEEIRVLEKNAQVLKNNNAELLILNQAKDNKIKKLEDELNKSVPKDLVASVLSFDDKFDFVIIDKGRKDQLVESAELIVHTKDYNYVCKLVVSKLYDDKAVCEIIDTEIKKGNPATGDVVIVHP